MNGGGWSFFVAVWGSFPLIPETKGNVIGEFKNFEMISNFLTEVSLKKKRSVRSTFIFWKYCVKNTVFSRKRKCSLREPGKEGWSEKATPRFKRAG